MLDDLLDREGRMIPLILRRHIFSHRLEILGVELVNDGVDELEVLVTQHLPQLLLF